MRNPVINRAYLSPLSATTDLTSILFNIDNWQIVDTVPYVCKGREELII